MTRLAEGVARLGIPQVDAILSPIPEHATLLLANSPGTEVEPFAYQIAAESIKEGTAVVYCVVNRSPSSVQDALREHHGVDGHDPALHFVDAFSALMGVQEDVAFRVRDPKEMDDLISTLEDAGKQHPDAVLILDGISTVIDNVPPDVFVKRFSKLLKAVRSFRASATVFTDWQYPDEVRRLLGGFDAEIRVRGVEDRVTFGQYFSVEKAAWIDKVDSRPRLFKVLKPGGVFVYIPKIVVTGPHNAGKSNFVHSVSDTAVSADRLGTTVALDHGRVLVNGVAADLFGTPGQERFDAALKTIAGQALGVIILVDSTKPETFDRARQMMDKTWRDGLPAIIGANKQDQPGALEPDEVARRVEPPAGVEVIGCVATDRESARAVLDRLIDRIALGDDS